MSDPSSADPIEVRVGTPDDVGYAARASEMIARAARDHDIAEREPDLLAGKIESGRAVLALRADELVGFGFFSEWQGGAFVSHSGLVVDPSLRGHGIGRRLKEKLFEASERMFPDAATMSLTTSEAVRSMNVSLGFRPVPFDRMTTDEAFWDGCKTCRNYAETKRAGLRCCCEGMLRPAGG